MSFESVRQSTIVEWTSKGLEAELSSIAEILAFARTGSSDADCKLAIVFVTINFVAAILRRSFASGRRAFVIGRTIIAIGTGERRGTSSVGHAIAPPHAGNAFPSLVLGSG